MQASIYALLAAKDAPALAALTELPPALSAALSVVLKSYGGMDIVAQARQQLPRLPAISTALDSLQWLAQRVIDRGLNVDALRFDLADLGGYGYYTATRFSIYSISAKDALARGGRYDEVGAVFGRKRPAAGFSLDIKTLVESALPHAPKAAIYVEWQDDVALRLTIKGLRNQGETVIYGLPGHESETDEFACDRELALMAGQWIVKGK
jgi:ATP phosphoribosyltransferase regulatory subunit